MVVILSMSTVLIEGDIFYRVWLRSGWRAVGVLAARGYHSITVQQVCDKETSYRQRLVVAPANPGHRNI